MKASPTRNDKIAVAYIRVSTEEQHLGPIAQRDAINSWCAVRGITLAAVYEDKQSGGLPLDKRPVLMDAVDSMPTHNAGVFLVAKRDRLARDIIACAMIERLVQRHGGVVLSAAGEGTGSDDPTATLMRRVVDAFSEYERLLIRARTKAALAVLRESGRKTGGPCPNGFVDLGDGNLEPIYPVLNEVVKARREGIGVRGLARRLNERKMRTSLGKLFSPTQAQRLVDNYASRGFLDEHQ